MHAILFSWLRLVVVADADFALSFSTMCTMWMDNVELVSAIRLVALSCRIGRRLSDLLLCRYAGREESLRTRESLERRITSTRRARRGCAVCRSNNWPFLSIKQAYIHTYLHTYIYTQI
ncbi:hypothetical protein GGR51DRAFT_522590 [Nemania sp. FL0031]|nr:hypothetical protein GGR51DRAFT_522590 [Nemania sp. FL0031]